MPRSLLLAVLMCPALASAQSAPARVDDTGRPLDGDAFGFPDADGVRPANFTVPGQAESVSRAIMGRMVAAAKGQQVCDRNGCLVIVNDNRDYRLTGFFVAKRGEKIGKHTSELQSRRNLVCRLLLAKTNPHPPPP